MNDFREFDKLFFLKLKDNFDKINVHLSNQLPKLTTYIDFYNKYHSFIFNYCIELICITDTHKERYFKDFEIKINELVKSKNLNINDCLLRPCMFSFGYKTAKTPLFLSDDDNNTVRIEQISSQLEIFQKERALSPIFHLYYLPTYNQTYNTYDIVNIESIRNILAEAAIETVLTC